MQGGAPAYGISKVALDALTRKLAFELKRNGILVNSGDPGLVAIDMGGQGGRPVKEGAKGIVWAATLPDDGPTGGFFMMVSQKSGKLTNSINCRLVHRYPVKMWEKGTSYLRYYITSNCPVLQSVKKIAPYAPQKNNLKKKMKKTVRYYHNNNKRQILLN